MNKAIFGGVVGKLLTFSINIFETVVKVPLFLGTVGVALYQDWLILFAAASFLLLGDFGLEPYLGNRFAEYLAKESKKRVKRVVSIGIGLYLLIIPVIIFTFIASTIFFELPDKIGVGNLTLDQAITVFLLIGMANILHIPINGMLGLYRAHGHTFWQEFWVSIMWITRLASIAIVLLLGGELLVAAIAFFVSSFLLGSLLMFFDLRRRYPVFRVSPTLPSKREMAALLPKAGLYWVNQSSIAFQTSVPILLIGMFAISSHAVALYSVLRSLSLFLRQFSIQLGHAVGIEMGRQSFKELDRDVPPMLVSSISLILAMTAIAGGGILVFAENIVQVWTLGKIVYDPLIFSVLIVSVLLIVPSEVIAQLLHYSDRPKILIVSFLLQIVIVTICSYILIPRLDLLGAVISFGVGEVIARGFFVPFVFFWSKKFSVGKCLGSIFFKGLAGLVIGLFTALLILKVFPVSNAALLFFDMAIWLVAVILIAFLIILDSSQKKWVLRNITKVKVRFQNYLYQKNSI